MSLIFMIVGARGCGKTKVRELVENFGFLPVDNEKLYLKYGALYPDKVANEDSEIQDLIYQDAQNEIAEKATRGDVVYESTGTNDRWVNMKDAIAKHHSVLVCKVMCKSIVAEERMVARGWDNNYPSSQEYTKGILSKSDGIVYDFLVENDGTIKDLYEKVLRIMRKIIHAK